MSDKLSRVPVFKKDTSYETWFRLAKVEFEGCVPPVDDVLLEANLPLDPGPRMPAATTAANFMRMVAGNQENGADWLEQLGYDTPASRAALRREHVDADLLDNYAELREERKYSIEDYKKRKQRWDE